MNKHKTALVLCSLLVAGALSALLARGYFPAGVNAAEHRPDAFASASVGPIRDVIIAKGTIAYDHQVVLRAPVAGRIASAVPQEGATLRRGQDLLRIVDTQDPQELELRRVEQQRCQTKLTAVRKDVQVLARLVEVGSSAPYELDQKKLELEMTAKDCERARIELARMSDKQARGDLRSPLDGMVIAAPSVAGQLVNPGDELLTVAGGAGPFIVSYLDATDLQRIHVGQAVVFSDQDDSERRHNGRVREIARAIGGTLRQNSVKIVVEPVDPIGDLRLSQQLYVEFVLRAENAVLRVPRELVYEQAGRKLVNVLTAEGVRARQVSTAPGDANFDRVLAGIGVHDRLLPRNALPGTTP